MDPDHSLLHCVTHPTAQIPWNTKEEVRGYKLDDNKVEEWVQALEDTGHFEGIPPMNSITDLDLAVDVLFDAFETASGETFEKRRPTKHNKTSRWWNSSCEAAVAKLKAATTDDDERTLAAKQLKVTRTAKCNWADDYIQKAGVWNSLSGGTDKD